jgi:hypothetical protein
MFSVFVGVNIGVIQLDKTRLLMTL